MIRITEPAQKRRKTVATHTSTLTLSVAMITGVYWFFQGFFPPWLPAFFGAIGIIALSYIALSSRIDRRIWRHWQRKRLNQPEIGIISEEGCPSPFTRFEPGDWNNKLSGESSFLSVDEIDDEFAVIVNPYGEAYPEKSTIELPIFDEILSFISNGGIFVCAGGYPFFYAWHLDRERQVPLAEDSLSYTGPIRRNQALLQPTVTGAVSLIDTLLTDNFNIKTTLGDDQARTCSQKSRDQEYAGDLVNVGGIDRIREFRAIREPAGDCIPLFRSTVQPQEGEEYQIYPLAAIPFGEGFLITAGMKLDGNHTYKGHNLDDVGFQKIVEGVENFLEYQKKNL